MYPTCKIIHLFLINLVSCVDSALGEYCYYYHCSYHYQGNRYGPIVGTIAGAAVGVVILLPIVVGMAVCICYSIQRFSRTVTTVNIAQSIFPTVHHSYQRKSSPPPTKPLYKKYLPYQQPGIHRQLTTLTVIPSTAAYCYYSYYHLYLYFLSYLVLGDKVGIVIGTICGLVLLTAMIAFLRSQIKSKGVKDTIVRQGTIPTVAKYNSRLQRRCL